MKMSVTFLKETNKKKSKLTAGVFVIFLLFQHKIFAEGKLEKVIKLPTPVLKGKISIEEAIKNRRTRREYSKEPLTLEEISQLLWAGQGITDEQRGYRSAPSAGALYPLELYVIIGKNSVKGKDWLVEGLYHYLVHTHSLKHLLAGELRKKIVSALYAQNFVSEAPIIIIISAVYERTTTKYGEPGIRYVHIEVGHAAQNILLQAESLSLSVGLVGAGNWDKFARILKLPSNTVPLYCLPVGKRK